MTFKVPSQDLETWFQPGPVFAQKYKPKLPWYKKFIEFLSYPEKEALNLPQYEIWTDFSQDVL